MSPTGPRVPVIAGAIALLALVALDAATGEENVFVSAFLLGPVLAALSGLARTTAAFSAVAVAAALASGAWNDNFGELDYFVRIAVVIAGAAAAVLAAYARERAVTEADASVLAQAQLTAVLENLAESVTVQDSAGRVVFANQAAADLLDAASPDELLGTPPRELMERFTTFNEDGSPLRFEQLPGRRLLAGEEPTPLVVRAINNRTGEERWRVTKATAVRDEAGAVRLVVNIIEDVTEVKRAELHQRLLAEASAILASSLDYHETLKRVAEMAVPAFADWCSVLLPGQPPYFEQVAVAHVDPARLEFAEIFRERYPSRMDVDQGAGAVLRTGQPQLVSGITPEMVAAVAQDAEHANLLNGLGMRSAIIAPMSAGGRTTGVISFVTAESGRDFSEADLGVAVELGRRAGLAVEHARQFTQRTEVADSLSQGLLPPELPEMGAWSAKALYRAASQASAVGGDFYDVFRVRDGWMLIVGDIAGRGPTAATVTALARYTLRTAGTLTSDPQVAVASLNRALRERPNLSLCSACVVVLREDRDVAEADVLCAGHPPPFLVGATGARQVGQLGPLLGALEVDEWPVARTRVESGEQLVLYTDGVLDVQGDGARFGERRLGEALAGAATPAEAIERVETAVAGFGAGVQGDDMAILAVLRGAGAPARTDRLPAGPAAARAARRRVEAELGDVLDARRLADTRLLVSEVVTNAIRHAPGEGAVTLTIRVEPAAVRVEVRDPGEGFELPSTPPDPELPGGRGLMLVDMLAERWGVGTDRGTCVWFEVGRR